MINTNLIVVLQHLSDYPDLWVVVLDRYYSDKGQKESNIRISAALSKVTQIFKKKNLIHSLFIEIKYRSRLYAFNNFKFAFYFIV